MTSSSPDREPRTEAEARLVAGRVNTEHLSVESIIETYADRLANAYPRDRAEFIDESRDLLDWWTARGKPAIESEAAHEARTAAEMYREMYKQVAAEWAAVLEALDLAPEASSDDVLGAPVYCDQCPHCRGTQPARAAAYAASVRERAAIRDLEQEEPTRA